MIVAVALWPIYLDSAFVVLAAVAITLGTALAVAGARWSWPPWGVVLATVATFTVVGVPLAVPGRTAYGVLPEPQGLLDLYAGVVVGWRQLLTIDLPVGTYQALLVPALVLLLTGPVLTMSIALRTRVGEVAAVVPLIAFVLAIAVGPEQPVLPISTSIALAATVVLWMAVWRRHRRHAAVGTVAAGDSASLGVRSIASAVVLLLIASGIGAAVAAVTTTADGRTVLRTIVEQPFDPLDQPSPLSAYRASFAPEVADEPALTVSGAPDGSRIRIAVLDSYDGNVFAVGSDSVDSASGRFVRIPTQRDLSAVDGVRASVSVTVHRASGVWLPTVGDFGRITIGGDDAATLRDRFVLNDVTGTAALVGGVPDGLEYVLDVVVDDAPGEASLDQATPGTDAVPGITDVPESLTTWLGSVSGAEEGPGAQLQEALDALVSQGYLSHGTADDEAPSRSGHSIERLESLFTDRPMVGDAEQYAVAAALIARELGFASRVVLGFSDVSGPSPVTLAESDRTAWIEVSTASQGWVPIDVVPERRELPPAEPDEPIPVSRPQNAVQPAVDDPPPLEELAPPEIEQSDNPELDPLWQVVLAILRVTGIGALIAAVLSSPLIAIVAMKARRRRRRRTAADPTVRIVGGWHDVTDAARDHGLELPSAATRSEIAAAIGLPQALVLARVTDRAVYAPEEPDRRAADQVWATADTVRASLAHGRSRREQWRAAISLRSLRRYRGAQWSMGGRTR
ncbi:transglutaminase domain-containing protein [Microcella sp.]|uniref:transglutaminase domain-containing protein n=1 Tax=Microcella sp. TaxID=1913979 RepID=UPI00299F6DF4|nr:transglutaminase domain-containing protein [Microcella sp.]MDX2025302.1 transglutaminaseTgpA domain-containing protein [Microcella sp.]